MPLIKANNPFAIWAVLCASAGIGLKLEQTHLGARLSGAVITILMTFAASNLGLIPVASPSYDFVWTYVIPLAIPLFLFEADLRRILREVGPTLIAYGFGAAGSAFGAWIGAMILPLGDAAWQLAGVFSATYIGGSVNFASTAKAVGLTDGALLSAGTAADNLIMTLYFLMIFALPGVQRVRAQFRNRPAVDVHDTPSLRAPRSMNLSKLSTALAIAFAFCATGFALAQVAGLKSIGILLITVISLFAATAFPKYMSTLEGAPQLGVLMMQLLFSVIGASAHIQTVIQVGPILLLYAALILAVHFTASMLGGKLCRCDLREVVVASNANVGGPTTATAMAASQGWPGLVTPAILVGTLGYSIATFIGVGIAELVRS